MLEHGVVGELSQNKAGSKKNLWTQPMRHWLMPTILAASDATGVAGSSAAKAEIGRGGGETRRYRYPIAKGWGQLQNTALARIWDPKPLTD